MWIDQLCKKPSNQNAEGSLAVFPFMGNTTQETSQTHKIDPTLLLQIPGEKVCFGTQNLVPNHLPQPSCWGTAGALVGVPRKRRRSLVINEGIVFWASKRWWNSGYTPWRWTWNIIMKVWKFICSCSFLHGWFVCSMWIFQGVFVNAFQDIMWHDVPENIEKWY